MANENHPDPSPDKARLYLPAPEGWRARIKQGWEKEYCYLQNPGEDHFHLILKGEVLLERGNEKYCLNCAHRLGVVTTDRLHWQRSPHSGLVPKAP